MKRISTKGTSGLEVKKGEPVSPEKFNGLRKAMDERRNLLPGPGVRERVLPWGTIRSYQGGVGSFTPSIWLARVMPAGKDQWSLTLGRGLVTGTEPVISVNGADVPISGDDNGVIPKLKFAKTDFDANGQAMLYLQVTVSAAGATGSDEWAIQRVTPVVLPALPPNKPWTALKLLGFLIKRGGSVRWEQMCYFNLELGTLYNRTAGGMARWVWWPV